MGKVAAVLVAIFVLAAGAYWLLHGGSDNTEAPVSAVPSPESSPALKLGSTMTGTDARTFVFTPTATPSPAKTAPASPPPGFQQKLDSTQAGLPTQTQLAALSSKEVHKTPAALFKAGTKIGEVAEAIEKDPSLAPQGMEFYAKCARRSELSTSVRALCLGNMRDLGRDSNIAVDEQGIDPKIKALADKLNEK